MRHLACSIAAALALAAGAAPAAHAARLISDAGRLVLEQGDASRLDLSATPGTLISLAGGLQLRIDGVQAEAGPGGRTVWLHQVSVADPHSGWRPLCDPHADGTTHLVFVPGSQRADGSLHEDAAAVSPSCTAGALAKCLRFGYRPWGREADGSPGIAAYNACLRMVRADYGGTDEPSTENGRIIDVYDDLGLQRTDLLPGQRFEAGWDAQGAVCVSAPRVPENITPEQIEARHPRLRGRVGAICTEAFARAHGAILFNRSGPAQ